VDRYDVVVVGGGHNALVAAAYLARAGKSVLVLERLERTGGAAVSEATFPGVDARLSRYSYLVSLLPDQIVSDLGLSIQLASRPVASYTPVHRDGSDVGLLVEREPGAATEESFRSLTGSGAEFAAWQSFYGELSSMAKALAPTFLEPLRSSAEIRSLVGASTYERFFERPLGEVVESTFADDVVRGVVVTDGLIGTFTHAHDPSLLQNRCFLYHLVGNGTGEWRVPVGGMGAVTSALSAAASAAGVRVLTGAEVTSVSVDGSRGEVGYVLGESARVVSCSYVLSGVAPAVLSRLLGSEPDSVPEGAQVKLNMVVTRLPRLRSGADPRQAFAGTFHVAEEYAALGLAYAEAAGGALPSRMPGELYCHTLTDPSILSPALAAEGWQTLTMFVLHTPARLFGSAAARDVAARRAMAALDAYLEEPLSSCLAVDRDGRPCLEVKTPLDIEAAVGMPGGHIFHGDLQWPWAPSSSEVGQWGVETPIRNLLHCASGARRGGGVSGIPGHNAAHALLALD
jgi:phytoene dehydrogenase-like protein